MRYYCARLGRLPPSAFCTKVNSGLPRSDKDDVVLTKLLIAMTGAGIFLRMVGKEKHRRHRHLLLRLEEKRLQLEAEEAAAAAVAARLAVDADDDSEPVVLQPVGDAA